MHWTKYDTYFHMVRIGVATVNPRLAGGEIPNPFPTCRGRRSLLCQMFHQMQPKQAFHVCFNGYGTHLPRALFVNTSCIFNKSNCNADAWHLKQWLLCGGVFLSAHCHWNRLLQICSQWHCGGTSAGSFCACKSSSVRGVHLNFSSWA